MGHRVSAYLSDELFGAWKASGLPLGEAVRRGLSQPPAPARNRAQPPRRTAPAAAELARERARDQRDADCAHPKSARDAKNPARCRCGAVNLPAPGRKS